MKFRTLLVSFALFLSLLSTGGMVFFTLSFFEKDKIASIFETELSNTKKMASHLESQIQLVSLIDIDVAQESRDIIFLFEDPCDRSTPLRGAVSRRYQNLFKEAGLEPIQWFDSLDVFKACLLSRSETKNLKPFVIHSELQLMIPYVLLVVPFREGPSETDIGHRIAMISMEEFNVSATNTLFLTDQTGERVWSADGEKYVASALLDTGATDKDIKGITERALQDKPDVQWLGPAGLISYAPLAKNWVLFSLSFKPAVLASTQFVLRQFVILAIGIFLLVFVIGKYFAGTITRPLAELQKSATQIGKGDFSSPLKFGGLEEFSSVRTAFNTMIDQIQKLIRETKKKTSLENELNLAKQVQKLLLPPTQVRTTGHRLYSLVRSAETVSGDWWGYLPLPPAKGSTKPPTKLLVLVGDATDHGSPSALVTATVRGGLSVLASWVQENPEVASDPRQILKYMNRTVFEAAQSSINMTMVAVILDLEAKKLICANGGHTFSYLLRDGKLKGILPSGPVLGQKLSNTFEEIEEYPWDVGSRVFLYTDGLVTCEKDGKNLFERKDVIKNLKSTLDRPASEIISRMMSHRSTVTGNLPEVDDVTVVVCEATGDADE